MNNFKTDKPFSKYIRELSFAVIATVIGGVVVALIIQDARFDPTRTGNPATTEERINSSGPLAGTTTWGACNRSAILPPYIKFEEDRDLAEAQIRQFIDSGVLYRFATNPEFMHLHITNMENADIRLEKYVRVLIRSGIVDRTHDNAIEIKGCGGGNDDLIFERMTLSLGDNNAHVVNPVEDEFNYDFYNLEPGEMAPFQFQFECTPGLYALEFEIFYTYLGGSDSVIFDPPSLIYCPNSFTIWNSDLNILNSNTPSPVRYTWTGSTYEVSE